MPQLYPVTSAEKVMIRARTLPSLLEDGVPPFHGDEPQEAAFYVEKGMLSAMRWLSPQGDKGASLPEEEWRRISLPPDQLLVPAFVDCHLHLALDGVEGFRTFSSPPSPQILLNRLQSLAAAGVLAVRDGGDQYGSAFAAQELSADAGASNQQAGPLPRVVATGPALFRQGHYGAKLGGKGLTGGLEGLQALIRKRKAEGAQQLKVVISGLVSLQESGKVGPLQFSPAELGQIVRIAGAYELPVMVHASSDAAVRLAVEAGVHSVEHGYYVSEESMRKMAGAGVAWVPTVAPLAALAGLGNDCGASETPQGSITLLRRIVEQHLGMIKRARKLGVIIGVGTDGGAPGVSWPDGYWLELKLLARAGMTPAELLTLAAVNGAGIAGLSRERGRIAVGKPPHWLCLDMSFLTGTIERQTLKGIIF